MTSLFVAQVDYGVTDDQLTQLFSEHGSVVKAHIAKDKDTGKPRGFAFVEMSTPEEAQNVITHLNGYSLNGRNIVVKLAEDRGNSRGGGQARGDRSQGHRGPRQDNRRPRPDSRPSTPSGNSPRPQRDDMEKAPFRQDFNDGASVPEAPKPTKRGKGSKKKKSDRDTDNRGEQKMKAYKKSGKSRISYDDDDDWEMELLRSKRRGWSEEDED